MNDVNLLDRDLRQRDLVPPEKLATCHALVIGVGAIGRQVALQLAAMGVIELTLVDHDVVDVVNLAPQGYMPAEIGLPKVHATAGWCRQINPRLLLHQVPERFKRSSVSSFSSDRRLVVFCCVDSITTRGIIWQAVRHHAAFFVDARMSGEVIRVLASAWPAEDTFYPTTLFAPSEAHAGSCTSKSTIYTASIAAGLMICQFTRWLRDLPVDWDQLLNLLSSELSVS